MLTVIPGHTGQIYFKRGDDKRIVARNLDLGDSAAVQRAVTHARQQYPAQSLKLGVYRQNGSAKKLAETLDLTSSALAGPEPYATVSSLPTHVPSPSVDPAAPAGNFFTQYVLREKDRQIQEQREQIQELRDARKTAEDRITELKEENSKHREDLRFKDREHELELAGVESSQKKGLAGLGETLAGFPPEILTMLASRFIGPAAALLPSTSASPDMTTLSPGHREIVEAAQGIVMQAPEETATKLYVVLDQLSRNPQTLDLTLQQLSPRM